MCLILVVRIGIAEDSKVTHPPPVVYKYAILDETNSSQQKIRRIMFLNKGPFIVNAPKYTVGTSIYFFDVTRVIRF